jgi:hypothetical protein
MQKWFALVVLVACSSPESPIDHQPPREWKRPEALVAKTVSTFQASAAGERDPVAAFALTASDGSGLQLTSLEAKAVIEGPLAFTELHLYFRNTEDRVREGTFAITLPQDAAVSRFAMQEGGEMKEAEVVAKALARRAYDDFLHRGIDPALLEKAAGNQFTARVFPIEARATKHIVLSYSHELANEGFVLPLRGLPKIDDVRISVEAIHADGSRATQVMHEEKWTPDRDFTANIATTPAIAHGNLVAGAFDVTPSFTDVALDASAFAVDRPTAMTILVDTSASRALGFRRYVAKVQALIQSLASAYEGLEIEVVAFDQQQATLYSGLAEGFGSSEADALLARGPAGASDLGRALPLTRARVVVVTDGALTAGVEGAELTKVFAKHGRVDVVLAGGIRDEKVASLIARAGRSSGEVFDLDRDHVARIASGLGEVVQTNVPIEVANAKWFYPRTLPSLRSGMQLTVYAILNEPATSFDVTIGNSRRIATVAAATPALLERATERAQIDELEAKLLATASDMKGREVLRKEIEKRSVAARVVSSQTSMIVLDSEADYARYGIDRKALANVLVVGPKGIEQRGRSYVASSYTPSIPQRIDGEPPPNSVAWNDQRARAVELARDAGLLGAQQGAGGGFAALTGTSDYSSGFHDANIYGGLYGTAPATGRGFASGASGSRMRGRAASMPAVSIGMPVAMGSLDKSFIKRYVKRSLNKIRYCYERELLTRSTLSGTIQTQFSIGSDGKVIAATATGMDPKVAECVAGVIKQIEFPKAPGAGNVQVNYPFTFRPSGSAPPEPAIPDVPAVPPDVPQARFAVTPPAPPQPIPPPITFDDPIEALDGKLERVMRMIAKKDYAGAKALAKQWRDESPGDVLAWIAVGEAAEATRDYATASRAYGSIIDLFGARAEFRRFAGQRLERTGERSLAVDTYRRAVADRPDQLTGHRLLAYALLRKGDHEGAWSAILAGVDQKVPEGRFEGADRVIGGDAGMIAAAYIANGGDKLKVMNALAKRNLPLVSGPRTRFMLYWETDANDVDLHVVDRHGNHAFYRERALSSGGELYADVTTGFGPECFELTGRPEAGPYELGVHYYAQGAMGYGMGMLQVVRFDGKAFTFEDRPFIIMKNRDHVSLGKAR